MSYKKRIFVLQVLVILVFGGVATAQTPQFDALKQKMKSGLILSSDFNHYYTDSYTGETLESEGKIWISQESYKLESEDQILVVDGETSKVYDQGRNRVIISTYNEEDDDFAPSRMLNGVDDSYTVTEVKSSSGTSSTITMVTDDDFALFVKVEVVVNEKGIPTKIIAYDISENLIVTEFKNATFSTQSADLFQLNYPETAEIIDTRN